MNHFKLSEENQRTLMIQLNVDIDRVGTTIAKNTARGMMPRLLYQSPPDNKLSEQEAEAIRALGNIPHLESALKKSLPTRQPELFSTS